MKRRLFTLNLSLCALAMTACGDDGGASADAVEADLGAAGGTPTADVGAGGDVVGGAGGAGGQAIGGAGGAGPSPDAGPTGCTAAYRYDPVNDTELTTFPDDFYTVADPSTGTGLRVTTLDAPWRPSVVRALTHVFEDLDTLDGFGVSAGIVLRFTAPVAEVAGGPQTATDGPVALWTLGDTPRRIAFEVKTADAGATLILNPMEPLPAHTPAGVVVERGLLAADGGCVGPSPTLAALLAGDAPDPKFAHLPERYAQLLAASGASADAVAAAVVFTTQSTTALSEAVSARIQASEPDWSAPPDCRASGDTVDCEGQATLEDFRTGDVIDDAEPDGTYDVKFSVWLPKERPAPVPVIVFGHGLGGARDNASGVADFLCPEGFAVFAVDALGHGEHPTAPPGNDPFGLIKFLGLDVATQQVYARRIRDNFRQSAFDKQQLLRILDRHADLDGDGVDDVDMSRVIYWGVSLGGIMGAEPLALDPHYSAGILTVAGARLIDIVAEAPAFAQFQPFLTSFAGGADALARAVPVIQTVVDGGDPVAYAPHVLGDRLAPGGERVPHVLQTMAIGDEIVFNPANRMLARALSVPHVPPVFQEVGLIPVEDAAPVSANVDGASAGLFQYDRVRESPNGRPVAASHNNAFAYEPINQMFTFLASWRDAAAPTIIDPYTELMTPPLP
jgi:dienelactone hydrolase